MRILKMIKGNTLWDERKSNKIRKECKTDDVVRGTRDDTRTSNISRNHTPARIARNINPASGRPPGLPPKKWKERQINR